MRAIDTLPGLPHRFSEPALLKQALTHRSLGSHNNERLEFLGDGVLNFIVAEYLYRERADAPEGDLSRLRANIVRDVTLAQIAGELNLGDHIRLGGGELKSGGFRRDSILADAVEALIGAVYLDAGFDTAQRFVLALVGERLLALPDADALKDPKTRLQELLQGRGLPLPEYHLVEESGADHNKRFRVACHTALDDKVVEAEAGSRRKAEQKAASQMLEWLEKGGDE